MAWLRVDDTALTHPKVLRLRSIGFRDGVEMLPEAVIGFVMLAATWSGQHLTDCFVPVALGPMASARWEQLAAAAVEAGLLLPSVDEHLTPGWLVVVGDGLFHLLSKEEVLLNRAKRNGTRRKAEKVAVLVRDGDQCRFCGNTVRENDHKSVYGRTIDHVDPEDPMTLLVVACRGCNSHKRDRTPEAADMELRPAPEPDAVFYQPKTLAWLIENGAHPRTGQPVPAPAEQQPAAAARAPRPGNQPGTAAPVAPSLPSATRPDPRPTPPRVAEPVTPGRDGMGRDGSGRSRAVTGREVAVLAVEALPSPTGPRAQGKTRRGTRGRTPGGRGVRGKGGSS